jgi:hypothetical protein
MTELSTSASITAWDWTHPLETKYLRKMRHGRKRHKKKWQKRIEKLPPIATFGAVFTTEIKETMARPGYAWFLFASDEEYIEWENQQHPWWTRTKR